MSPTLLNKAIKLMLSFALLLMVTCVRASMTPAGTVIVAQATATYFATENSGPSNVLSNLATVIVSPIAAVKLEQDQRKNAAPKQHVTFIHRLTQRGNIADRFRINVAVTKGIPLTNLQVYEYKGALPAPGTDPIKETRLLQPNDSVELVVMGNAPATINGNSTITLSAQSVSDNLVTAENHDIITVSQQAARLTKQVDKTEAKAGEMLHYRLNLLNTGQLPLPERQLTVDGNLEKGLLLEDKLPVYTQLDASTPPTVIPIQAKALVRTLAGKRWLTFDQWDKKETVTRIGLWMPSDKLATSQPAVLSFTASIEKNAIAGKLIRNEGFLTQSDTALPWLTSNQVETKVIGDSKQPSNPGLLHFTLPVSLNHVPDFSGTFRKTGYYHLQPENSQTQHDAYLELDDGGFRQSTEQVDTVDVLVASDTTGHNIKVKLVETGPNTGLFRSQFPLHLIQKSWDSSYCGVAGNVPNYHQTNDQCQLTTNNNDLLTATVTNPDGDTTFLARAEVSPQGYVFDSDSSEFSAVAGAKVTFLDVSGNPAVDRLTGKTVDEQMTGDDGRFGYPPLADGDYFINVVPPIDYTFPSSIPADRFEPGRHVVDASYGRGGQKSGVAEQLTSALRGSFHVSEGEFQQWFDVPLDPILVQSGLTLQKEAKQKTVAPGELVAYTLTLKNNTESDLYSLQVRDNLPLGFKYMKGSVRIDGKAADDPDGGAGSVLTFHVNSDPALKIGDELTITYALKAGAGAVDSDGINRAIADAITFPTGIKVQSNLAQAQVSVMMTGVLSDRAILFGKVYVDSNCSNIQDKGEWPVGGVRLYMEDGTWVITDENGQYSLMGLKPGSHVIKVDPVTMPDGLTLKPLDNRNGADGNSRFVDLASGEMHRADFAAMCPDKNGKAVFAQIKARNKSINGDWMLDDAAQYNRSTPTEKVDSNGDLSHGVVRGSQENTPQSDELLAESTATAEKTAPVVKMPLAEEAIKNVTTEQAMKGAWLWPETSKADGRFMAVVRAGVQPTLYVNGKAISHDRLGAQLVNNREQAQLMAWYGVPLKDGKNTVEIKAQDMFGNDRVLIESMFTQSGAAERVLIRPEANTVPADEGRSLLPVRIQLLDKKGQLANGVYFVTLESSTGRWQEPDIQDKTPGHQIRIDQGEAIVHFRSGNTTGPVTLKVSNGDMSTEAEITQVAAPRPLVAVGMVDINASHGSIKGAGVSFDDITAGNRVDKRLATFVKGEIAKDTQLTLSYDNKKSGDTELFRDVDPDDYYPITGDASQKGYDAQSRSKLYAKVERDRSSIMWGDYQTDSNGSDNDLARTQRTLTGFNGIYDNGSTRIQGFAARPEDNHITEVIEPNGTAMNYRLEQAPIIRNSEVLILETLDQSNGIVLKTRTLSRGTDYTVDEFSGYLRFTSPLHRRDETGYLQQVRAGYDVEGNGVAYTVAGARVQEKINEHWTVGASFTHDDNKTKGSALGGAWLEYKPSENTTIAVSGARMSGEEIDDQSSDATKKYQGNAARIKVREQWSKKSSTELTWARAGTGFKNSSGGVTEGREETRVQHKQQLSETTDARAELDVSESLEKNSNGQGSSAGVFVDHRMADGWTLTGGSRYIRQENDDDHAQYATGEVGAEKQFMLFGKDASIKAEYARALSNTRWRTALETHWKATEKVSLYGRFDRDDQLTPSSSSNSKNEFAFGVKSDWLPNTKTYSEYRMRGATDGQNMEWVNGAESSFEVMKGLSISPSVEWINTINGDDGNDGVALSMGIQDKRYKDQRANGRFEYRNGEQQDYYGVDAAIARRFSLDWSGLIREQYRLESPKDSESSKTFKQALTLGFARRPKLDNVQHGLYLAQWKDERGQNPSDDRSVYMLSTHQNWQLDKGLVVSGRLGTKWMKATVDDYNDSSQVWVSDVRLIWDIDRRWDMDLRGGLLTVDGLSSKRWSAGVGLYYLLVRNLRVGAYYNVIGFSDEDLDNEGYNAEGIHFTLQFKFDESIFDWFKS